MNKNLKQTIELMLGYDTKLMQDDSKNNDKNKDNQTF